MEQNTIEKAFSSALRLAKRKYGRGFQARVCDLSGAHPPNLSGILNKDDGCSEDLRRGIVEAVLALLPNFPAKGYESFLSLGRWILDGKNPEDWKPPAVIMRGSGSLQIKQTPPTEPPNVTSISLPPPRRQSHRVPIISMVQAGDWQDVFDPYQPGYAEE